jgi:hypothetical protein
LRCIFDDLRKAEVSDAMRSSPLKMLRINNVLGCVLQLVSS